ncbi:valine--tRNA ligase [Aestuariivirga litoralis]|uniref:Valine--tRNA ligase n=1 Tax=Aestuariivirga litoralis TaxID=2650924 RepID=A0A2W2AT48_9HYPH|nr:valine--tRNA ligase [Aestuariivirga litoralis]PZF76832.1 valine--tRNA ligase [Aestuariivirga litoralis]
MLEKTFTPAEMEARLYAEWEERGFFKPGGKPKAEPFTIVIPPPNVTGSLHMGHALNNTIQDILVRFERMRGKDVLWQPGTDHAGIATQMVVERLLQKENKTDRRSMGREAFLERVWAWKEESGGTISRQLRRLGASCDWSRERFTMDEGLSKAVLKVFVQLYKEGLIYKDKRLVNWDPKLLTAISDLEVVQKEVKGNLWHLRYPIEGSDEFIVVATTRPETMLGDSGVAVHPENEKLKHLIGKMVRLPLVGRLIPIVGDDYADPEKGTGAVKITPAHDFNDFDVGKRNELRQINVLDQFGKILIAGNADFLEAADVPAETMALNGLDRFEARKRIVEMFEAQGLLDKIEPHTNQVPHGDRSDVVIEPWLTEQWYVNAAELAKPAIAAVEKGETSFVPKNWEKTYYEWMRNIQPWCISRQLWWGHQIPAWYAPDGTVFVEETEAQAMAEAERHFGMPVKLTRDEDVLDTWFSSALWPFSTLGWPEETPELKRHYKTDVLVTGFDIIFFWVARMMMMGLHFMKEVPFHTVYIHALVRDEKGQKMSKSKGNVIDPLELIDAYGADALRFTLAAMAAQGRDIKLAKARVEGYRNFGTKLWNAARFAEMNGVTHDPNYDPLAARVTVNRWIAGETARTEAKVRQALDEYKFNEAAGALYQFVWNVFCDWYLELIKPILTGTDEAAKAETRATTAWVIDQILLLLHPFMPFVTEELWQQTGSRKQWLIASDWPTYKGLGDARADAEMEWVIRFISEVRSVRAEMNVPAGAKIGCVLVSANSETRRRADAWENEIMRLARLSSIGFEDSVPKASAQIVLDEATVALPLEGVIDFAAEKARLAKELEKIAKDSAAIDGRLNNPGFVAKAPPEVLEESRERKAELEARKAKVDEALARLG